MSILSTAIHKVTDPVKNVWNQLDLVVQKLRREWKTFALAIGVTASGAWELAAQWGADLPSMVNSIPEKWRSAVLFAVGFAFLILRRYVPTTVVAAPAPEATPENK